MLRSFKIHVLPSLVAALYWLWSRTWRFRVIEDPEFTALKKRGPVTFAHWHGDEMVVLRLGPVYKCAAMTSTSDDGELMTRVLKFFGFGVSRGSSTRGGVRAAVGLVHLVKEQGFSATMAVDGPKGPRHKVKPGVIAIAQHTGTAIVPTGVARSSALVFEKSWNKTFLPWPFSRVIVYFGRPLIELSQSQEVLVEKIEVCLHEARGKAQAHLLGR
ncbi:MAG: lysophospholipid acyltransferase family protein [Oligoflexia bacterium]|nr:lysophospholipid acyltransferase family protein [Oligoflexia bacterium]